MRWLVVIANTLPLMINLFRPDWFDMIVSIAQFLFGLWIFRYLGQMRQATLRNRAIYKLRGGK